MVNSLVAAFDGTNEAIAVTANGARTLQTSGSKSVDLFAAIGSVKDEQTALTLFKQAYDENPELAGRVALWSRDIRGGAGRRLGFRAILRWLEVNDFAMFLRFLPKVPELGRFDDLLVAETEAGKAAAYKIIAKALAERNGLAAKWMPRKGPKAAELREFLGLSPKKYRKLLVNLTNVIETPMCAKDYEAINYSHVPSVAGARYAKAFKKNDGPRYNEWIESLKKDPKAKVNTQALYPHDLYRSCVYGGQAEYANEAWKRLPDYYDSTTQSVLSIVDVSASMTWVKISGQIEPMDVAISLGLYTAQRNRGPFANKLMTFSTSPSWISVDPNATLDRNLQTIRNSSVAGSTYLQAVFKLILDTAKQHKVKAEDMPSHILIMSDMEFNSCVRMPRQDQQSRSSMLAYRSENFHAIDMMYSEAGYARPKIVFWNLNSRIGNNPVRHDENGTALVSGFSPAIVKAALKATVYDPMKVMLDTVEVERYNF